VDFNNDDVDDDGGNAKNQNSPTKFVFACESPCCFAWKGISLSDQGKKTANLLAKLESNNSYE